MEAETSKVNVRNFTMIEKNRSRRIFSSSHHDVIFPHEEITQRSIQAEIDTKVKDNNWADLDRCIGKLTRNYLFGWWMTGLKPVNYHHQFVYWSWRQKPQKLMFVFFFPFSSRCYFSPLRKLPSSIQAEIDTKVDDINWADLDRCIGKLTWITSLDDGWQD